MNKKIIVRKAMINELDEINNIFINAIEIMDKNNILQWDEVYPDLKTLKEDIIKKQMYVGEIDKQIASVFVLNNKFDEEYVKGAWEYTDESFNVVHRLCVNPLFQNQGIAKQTMCIIERLLVEINIQSIRLDAFSLNPYAIKLYENLGYKKVGEVNWRKGLFYLYEKNLNEKSFCYSGDENF